MSKITLDIEDFKILGSETRLDILRAIDKKNMSLKDISDVTKLHETTVHEHLTKLINSGFVNKKAREGHKWVYYNLSWKGSCLLHPDNTNVIVMFTTTITILFVGIIGLILLIRFLAYSIIDSSNGGFSSGGSSGFPFFSFHTFSVNPFFPFFN
jgi:ArsR family transcriptional regulator, arsenate/arsenite/antimonite-responsive transcriptional repressor